MAAHSSQELSPVFLVGTVLTLLSSFLIGLFNIAILFWFGVPIFVLIIGLSFVWINRTAARWKLAVTGLTLPTIVIGFCLFYILLPKAEPEIFLIPDKFRGQFAIMFNEDCGESGVYEAGKRIYRIPDDGIVISKLAINNGLLSRSFYLTDENENRTLIPEFHWSDVEREKQDWHWKFSDFELNEDLVGVFWAYQRDFSFIVSDYRSYETGDKNSNEQKIAFRKKLYDRLDTCRKMTSY